MIQFKQKPLGRTSILNSVYKGLQNDHSSENINIHWTHWEASVSYVLVIARSDVVDESLLLYEFVASCSLLRYIGINGGSETVTIIKAHHELFISSDF